MPLSDRRVSASSLSAPAGRPRVVSGSVARRAVAASLFAAPPSSALVRDSSSSSFFARSSVCCNTKQASRHAQSPARTRGAEQSRTCCRTVPARAMRISSPMSRTHSWLSSSVVSSICRTRTCASSVRSRAASSWSLSLSFSFRRCGGEQAQSRSRVSRSGLRQIFHNLLLFTRTGGMSQAGTCTAT